MVADGVAPKITQTEEGATYDAMMKKDTAQVPLTGSAQDIHNFIRGCEHHPGAWVTVNGEVRLFYMKISRKHCKID